jgi:hypothetical protein
VARSATILWTIELRKLMQRRISLAALDCTHVPPPTPSVRACTAIDRFVTVSVYRLVGCGFALVCAFVWSAGRCARVQRWLTTEEISVYT